MTTELKLICGHELREQDVHAGQFSMCYACDAARLVVRDRKFSRRLFRRKVK